MVLALLLAAGAIGAACSSAPSATSTSTTSALSGVGGWTHFADAASPTDLPTSCKLGPRLAPVTQTPTWPTGYQILDAVPGDLVKQFPTVFGGVVAAPAQPGESAVQVNSHFIVLETEHDPALETEVRAAYPAAIGVAFALTPWSMACLTDTSSSVNSAWKAAAKARITVWGDGIQRSHVVVEVSACMSKSELSARAWFSRRWGAVVSVQTCQKPAVLDSAYAIH
jgi:hypothetical protein